MSHQITIEKDWKGMCYIYLGWLWIGTAEEDLCMALALELEDKEKTDWLYVYERNNHQCTMETSVNGVSFCTNHPCSQCNCDDAEEGCGHLATCPEGAYEWWRMKRDGIDHRETIYRNYRMLVAC